MVEWFELPEQEGIPSVLVEPLKLMQVLKLQLEAELQRRELELDQAMQVLKDMEDE
mgnify:CR=1 FL=1